MSDKPNANKLLGEDKRLTEEAVRVTGLRDPELRDPRDHVFEDGDSIEHIARTVAIDVWSLVNDDDIERAIGVGIKLDRFVSGTTT
jgi:hypothetical protein